jgi:hypothetical protein
VVEAEGGEVETIIAMSHVDAESFIRQNAAAIKALAHELMQARWMELSGEEVEHILERNGVQRVRPRGVDVSSHGRGPQPGQERYYERRNGTVMPVARADPERQAYDVQCRCDGYVA